MIRSCVCVRVVRDEGADRSSIIDGTVMLFEEIIGLLFFFRVLHMNVTVCSYVTRVKAAHIVAAGGLLRRSRAHIASRRMMLINPQRFNSV